METSLTMKKIYMDIQEKIYYMIPEKWDSIFLYASIFEGINNLETGEMFFYYLPKGLLKKQPINVYEIPNKFNIDEDEFLKLTDELYRKIKKLKEEFIRVNKKVWTNITISIKNYKFIVEYDYEDLKNCEYNSYERHIIWRYMYLNTGLNTYNKKERTIINSYLERDYFNNQKKDKYIEGIYRNRIHNVINYNKEEKNIEELKFIENDEKTNENKQKVKNTINQILRY